jgi:lipoprotein-releasing system permease protein
MPYELFIAMRYLRARRKQVMVSVISVIAVMAVAAGVASLITVLAMMTGFREEFQTRILSGTAHINLSAKDGRPIENYRELIARIESLPRVRSGAATLYQEVLIQGSNRTTGAILKGADLSASPDANEVFQFTIEGDPRQLATPETDPGSLTPVDRIILGRFLAEDLGLKIGDVATVISPEGHLTPMGLAPRYRDYKVAGLFESGLADYDAKWAYISLEAAQRLAGAEGVAQIIQMKVDDVDDVKAIKAKVLEAVGREFEAQDWQELNAPIYSALSYEKYLSAVALLIVIGIAALNIITVLIMIVMEKRADIAILKTLGATSRSVMYIFMIEGLTIGIIGMIIGVFAGAGFCHLADSRRWIELPAGAYALDYLPFHINATDVLIVAAVSIAISFISTLYPAWNAARIAPVDALRYE